MTLYRYQNVATFFEIIKVIIMMVVVVIVVVAVVAFSSFARIFQRMFDHSFPASAFFFFSFLKCRLARTQ